MLPKYHQQYTTEILKDFKLSMEKKKQIDRGYYHDCIWFNYDDANSRII